MEPAVGEAVEDVENTFQGLKQPEDGSRANVVAPPTMPHRSTLREDCLSCHSPESPYESLRTPHPDRKSCRQCHVDDGETEFKLQPSD
jgi:nitrate/TMAO reductase-like tetraheme cytochrome c subunit